MVSTENRPCHRSRLRRVIAARRSVEQMVEVYVFIDGACRVEDVVDRLSGRSRHI